ncbi:hypothetical protein TrST_g8868 [Triparma strigata]|uniref:Uncharacterized protein n=1 Tax=Triparma strigata TaxID=1606541 RepID=A0A9W6ZLH3_9STRA|nr:hypothetical protein TrST_g8868 [Triparma strigata]
MGNYVNEEEINYNIFHPPSSYYSYYSFEPISISFDSEIIDVGFWKQIVGGNGRDGGGKGSFERGTGRATSGSCVFQVSPPPSPPLHLILLFTCPPPHIPSYVKPPPSKIHLPSRSSQKKLKTLVKPLKSVFAYAVCGLGEKGTVHLPIFRYDTGKGTRQIYEHIKGDAPGDLAKGGSVTISVNAFNPTAHTMLTTLSGQTFGTGHTSRTLIPTSLPLPPPLFNLPSPHTILLRPLNLLNSAKRNISISLTVHWSVNNELGECLKCIVDSENITGGERFVEEEFTTVTHNTQTHEWWESWNIRVPPRPLPEAILTAVLHVHNLKLKRSSDKEKTVVEYLGSALVNLRESTTVPVDYILGSNGELTRSDLDKKSDPMEIVVEIVRSPFVPSEISDVYRLGPKAPQVDWGPSGVEWREEDDVEVVKKLARICSVEGRMLWREIREISGVIVLSMTSGRLGCPDPAYMNPANPTALRVNALAVLMVVASKAQGWICKGGWKSDKFVKLFSAIVTDRRGWGGKVFESDEVDDDFADSYSSDSPPPSPSSIPSPPKSPCGSPTIENYELSPETEPSPSSNRKRCNTFPSDDASSLTSPLSPSPQNNANKSTFNTFDDSLTNFGCAPLSTIKEVADDDRSSYSYSSTMSERITPVNMSPVNEDAPLVDDSGEFVVKKKGPVKQMRVPPRPSPTAAPSPKKAPSQPQAPSGFLEKIGADLGISAVTNSDDLTGEKSEVGMKHHRKTKSVCSIDWSTPGGNNILAAATGNPPHHAKTPSLLSTSNSGSSDSMNSSAAGGLSPVKHQRTRTSGGGFLSSFLSSINSPKKQEMPKVPPQSKITTTASIEIDGDVLHLPLHGNTIETLKPGEQWWPYLYEVIIYQWATLLSSQQRLIDTGQIPDQAIHAACVIGKGVTISSAPVMFEIIKISLCRHVTFLSDDKSKPNPRVSLPQPLMDNLASLVRSLTKACIAPRNFDKISSRRIARDVSSKLIMFIRDLFDFLQLTDVQRLVNVFYAEFVDINQSGVSKLNVRYSSELWELRLEAVRVLSETPDYGALNLPLADSWEEKYLECSDQAHRHPRTKNKRRIFFKGALDEIRAVMIPPPNYGINEVNPHWLASIIVHQSLAGIEHGDFAARSKVAEILLQLLSMHSREGAKGHRSPKLASMYVPVLQLLTSHVQLLAMDEAKSIFRINLLSGFLWILQSAPPELLGALWRDMLLGAQGCGKYEFLDEDVDRGEESDSETFSSTLMAIFDLLNLSLASLEYEPATTAPGKAKNDAESQRMWFSHDACLIVVSTARSILKQLLFIMDPSSSLLGESTDLRSRHIVHVHLSSSKTGPFSVADVSSIVRTIASVYLHGLSLHISDAAATGLIAASVELLKAVGLNMFLLSLQDSLQDWMRMLLLHSGARRATVRVQALEFLVLLLRASWTTFGTLSKIRLPALAIFAEVCEKMAQPHLASGHSSIVQALAPILKSLERMEQSTVSRNMAFKAALHRFAGQLHAIYRGFLASVPKQSNNFNEATEEELMAAASCFDKYELPFHRAYWLHLLAELHEERKHFAEAGACRFEIYNTLKASEGHAKVWNPRPFARWEGIHRRSGAYAQNQPRPLDDAELAAEIESNLVYAGELFKLAGSKKAKATFTLAADLFASRFDDDGMRRAYLILSTLDKNKVPILEAHPESPKISNLTGIAVNPSPHAPSDCGTFFRVYFHGSAPDDLVGAEYVYRAPGSMPIEKFGDHVAAVLHGLLPPHVPVDLILDDGRTNQQSNTKGHYIARPSQRRGKVAGGQRLREREGEGTMDGGVCEVKITPLRPVAGRQSMHTTGSKEWFEMRCKTAQHAVNSTSASASAAAPTAAGQQILSNDSYGSFGGPVLSLKDTLSSSYSRNSCDFSVSSVLHMRNSSSPQNTQKSKSEAPPAMCDRDMLPPSERETDSFSTFTFTIPLSINDDRRSSSSSDNRKMVEKNLRLTTLKVAQSFPTTVSRLPIANRTVALVSPLQENVSTVCSWNAIMFQTVLATTKLSVNFSGEFQGHGIGKDAAKILVDALHQSRICTMAVKVLSSKSLYQQRSSKRVEVLPDAEVLTLKRQLSRSMVMFLELLHTLLIKNRELLLAWVARKRAMKAEEPGSEDLHLHGRTSHRSVAPSYNFGNTVTGVFKNPTAPLNRGTTGSTSGSRTSFTDSVAETEHENEEGTFNPQTTLTPNENLKSDIGVQSELQRSFSSTTKCLYPLLVTWINEDEVPRWIEMSGMEGYFASSSYKVVKMETQTYFERSEWGEGN